LNSRIADKQLLVGGRGPPACATASAASATVLTICESSLQAIVGATTESVGIAPARKISPRQLIGVGEVIAKFSYPELDSIQHSRDDWLADRLLLDDGICKSEPSPGGPTFSDGPIYRRAAFRKLVHPEI